MIHEDDRRTLEEWPEAKVITAKKDCVLGGHYHKIKTEKFILLSGKAKLIINTMVGDVGKVMKAGKLYTIDPNIKHSFELKEGAVLIGMCSHPYDPTDEYRL